MGVGSHDINRNTSRRSLLGNWWCSCWLLRNPALDGLLLKWEKQQAFLIRLLRTHTKTQRHTPSHGHKSFILRVDNRFYIFKFKSYKKMWSGKFISSPTLTVRKPVISIHEAHLIRLQFLKFCICTRDLGQQDSCCVVPYRMNLKAAGQWETSTERVHIRHPFLLLSIAWNKALGDRTVGEMTVIQAGGPISFFKIHIKKPTTIKQAKHYLLPPQINGGS